MTTYGALLAISTLGGAIGSTLGGWFGTRTGWALPLVGGLPVSGLTTLAIVNAPVAPVYAAGLISYGVLYLFTVAYILGAAAMIDRTGRLAIFIQGYSLVVYAIGPFIFGIASSLVGARILGIITALLCTCGAIVIWPLARTLDRSTCVT